MPRRDAREDAERVHPEDRAAWRTWLAEHHERRHGVWLVTWRTVADRAGLTYDEAVREALCFGWVDSTARALDETRTMTWMSPRKPGSGWARTNKARVVELEADGLLAEAGRRVIDAAKADGSWTALDDVEAGIVPDDLDQALASVDGARARFDAFPPSARRALLQWVAQARRPETRARRVADVAEKAGRGERANEWRPRAT